ncbi:MAG TPA: hypothetical protein VHH88_02760 [Verrucomicrobiae bacterium]|nr:hypothetical protein [Verrucomicrobiae bacterium]
MKTIPFSPSRPVPHYRGSDLAPGVNHLRTPGQPLRLRRWMFRHASFGIRHVLAASALLALAATTGCQVLTYKSPTGETFTRSSLGSDLSISSLAVSADTNGVRAVNLQGYQNSSTQALGTVTDAAVRAAVSAATK